MCFVVLSWSLSTDYWYVIVGWLLPSFFVWFRTDVLSWRTQGGELTHVESRFLLYPRGCHSRPGQMATRWIRAPRDDGSPTCLIGCIVKDGFLWDQRELMKLCGADTWKYLRGHAKAWPDRRLVRNDRSSVKWSIRYALESYIIPMSKGLATIPQTPKCGMFRKRSLRHLSEWHLSESHLSEPFSVGLTPGRNSSVG